MVNRKRRFAVISAVVLVLLVIGYGAVSVCSHKPAHPAKESRRGADGFHLLMILDKNGTADHMALLSTDPQNGTVSVTAVPPQTASVVGGRRLTDIYKAKGGAATANEAAGILSLAAAYYCVMTPDQFAAFINKCEGGLPFTLEEPIAYADEETGYSLKMDAGRYTLTGTQAAGILLNSADKSGAVSAQMVAAWWNRYAVPQYTDRLQKDYRNWFNCSDTDFGVAAFSAHEDGLRYLYACNGGSLATVLQPKGSYSDLFGVLYFIWE